MDDQTLFIVALSIPNAKRRRRMRDVMRYFGDEILPGLFEVPGSTKELNRLQAALTMDLAQGDEVRIYPICARCRSRARLFGTDSFATIPVAYIF